MMVNGKQGGIDVEILREITGRMGYAPHFRNCALDDCLGLMRQGQADLMTSLLRRADREAYILYVQPRYRARSDKVFYLRKENPKQIRTFDDLKALRIGVKTGANYAPAFDNDKELNKVPAQSIKLNISKLVAGQIDTFITTDLEGDYWIKQLGLEERYQSAIQISTAGSDLHGHFQKIAFRRPGQKIRPNSKGDGGQRRRSAHRRQLLEVKHPNQSRLGFASPDDTG
jgi:ABC-type amino acid transport substrate-binding protein